MIEVWNIWLSLPLKVQFLCMTPLLSLPLLWLIHPRRLGQGWSYDWQKRIDREIRTARKRTKREDRKVAMNETFTKLVAELEKETGRMAEFGQMPPEHRHIWWYFLQRIHYHL